MSELVGARAIAAELGRLAGLGVSDWQVYRLADQPRSPITRDREKWKVHTTAAALSAWWGTSRLAAKFAKRLKAEALGRDCAPVAKRKHIEIRAASGKTGELMVVGVVGAGQLTTASFLAAVKQLGDVDTIHVVVNSDGGLVNDGLAIYHALRTQKAKVHVEIVGVAASMASAIAMVGHKISMAEDGLFMLHDPWGNGVTGNADDLRAAAEQLDKFGESLAGIYARRTKHTEEQILAMMKKNGGEGTWLNAKEALELGFIDEIISPAQARLPANVPAAAMAKRIGKAQRQGDLPVKKFAAKLAALIAAMVKGDVTKEDVVDTLAVESELTVDKVSEIVEGKSFPTLAQLRVFADVLGSSTNELRPLAEADGHKFEARKPKTAPPQVPALAQVPDVAAAVREALAADRTRVLTIQANARQHGLPDDAVATIVAASADIAAGNTAILAWLSDPKNKPRINPVAGNVQLGDDERDKFIAGATQALLMRAGVEKRETGNELYGRSLCDLAEMILARQHISTRGMTKDQIARKIMASHTSSDFPLLLANSAGKVLRNAYTLAPVTWNRWCKIGSVSDFKQASRLTLGSFSSLLLKPEGGEYKQGTVGEEREPITAITKGRFIQMSREMLVNDDLGAFVDMSRKMGRAAARTVESDVYALLTSAAGAGPTMSDSGAFFNATAITTAGGHANLTSSGTAISVASIAVGEAMMMAQKDKGLNDFVVIQPRVLLCAPGKKQIAWETVNSLTDVASSNANKKNYVQAQMNLEVVSSPYLTSTPWYLFGDPADAEAFEVAFLDGVQEPFIDEEVEFMTDAMNMKVRLDYGVAAIDWRAGYRNAGA
jgi:ATP-dependent protease ClpP protease subunit